MGEERALLNDDGLPGRPWFRHLIYAPLPSYEAETLPGQREALGGKNVEAAREEAKRLGASLDNARKQPARLDAVATVPAFSMLN